MIAAPNPTNCDSLFANLFALQDREGERFPKMRVGGGNGDEFVGTQLCLFALAGGRRENNGLLVFPSANGRNVMMMIPLHNSK